MAMINSAHPDILSGGTARMPEHAAARVRDLRIDTLRGLACILLVAFHVIGSHVDVGMQVNDSSWWRTFADLAQPVRMPLFAFLSGYVFVTALDTSGQLSLFLRNRIMRLGLPFLSVVPLFAVLSCTVGSTMCTVSPVKLYINPYAHYWFLQASILIAIIAAPTLYLAGSYRKQVSLLCMVLVCILFLSGAGQTWLTFSVSGAMFLLPFFTLGIVFRQWKIASVVGKKSANGLAFTGTAGLLSAVLFVLYWNYDPAHALSYFGANRSALSLALSLSICTFLYLVMPVNQALASIGSYSFAIYLFHPLFSSVSRRVLEAFDPATPDPLVFAAGLTLGLGMPVLLQQALKKSSTLNLLLLGVRRRERAGRQMSPSTLQTA
jgi:fucose 4-O-acetylase-like acetyltransferase